LALVLEFFFVGVSVVTGVAPADVAIGVAVARGSLCYYTSANQ
jgi:hypothetical protein